MKPKKTMKKNPIDELKKAIQQAIEEDKKSGNDLFMDWLKQEVDDYYYGDSEMLKKLWSK